MKTGYKYILLIFLSSNHYFVNAQSLPTLNVGTNRLIFSDGFFMQLDTSIWKVELDAQPRSKVYSKDGGLILDTKGGVTVWLKKELFGNIAIEYDRTVLVDTGTNDRLSDLNNFWMATDPKNTNLFTRNGVLEKYDSLQLYYVGMGGNTNKTNRFRKYEGDGKRTLLQEYTDSAHLLKANTTYHIVIVCKNATTQFFVDGAPFFNFTDPHPLLKGYFGFRSTKSRQVISGFKVWEIISEKKINDKR